jgi:1-phosphatidylinositol-3-phosphate 5-kinase
VEDPCSLVSFALASADTRDLLGILEEAYELAVEASSSANDFVDDLEVDVSAPPKTKNDLPGSRISAELERVSQALIDGRYPRNFWHRSGRWVYQSSITDGAHIEFKCFYSSGSSSAGAKEVGATDNLLWSTTIHYAYFFERMRSNASITLENYIRSLSQSEQWQPIGGKSASRFFRTKDDRFIVKQVGLKRKWWSSIWSSRGSNHQQSASIATSSPPAGENLIADQEESRAILSVLLKYLDYTTGGQDEISLIVKTFGSYQVTINNTEQLGISVNNNLHLLIMDNLFYDRPNISRKFDLKGIYSRTAAPRTSESNESSSIPAGKKPQLFGNLQNFISLKTTDGVAKAESERPETPQSITLLDANWIQSLHQPLEAKVSGDMSLPLSFGQVAPTTVLFLHPHSRRLLDEAVANDTDFLARANIIDYSMLVGVDLETGELIVGLVDYLIEYNTWKALENKSKVTLKTLENTISTANLVKSRILLITVC